MLLLLQLPRRRYLQMRWPDLTETVGTGIQYVYNPLFNDSFLSVAHHVTTHSLGARRRHMRSSIRWILYLATKFLFPEPRDQRKLHKSGPWCRILCRARWNHHNVFRLFIYYNFGSLHSPASHLVFCQHGNTKRNRQPRLHSYNFAATNSVWYAQRLQYVSELRQ